MKQLHTPLEEFYLNPDDDPSKQVKVSYKDDLGVDFRLKSGAPMEEVEEESSSSDSDSSDSSSNQSSQTPWKSIERIVSKTPVLASTKSFVNQASLSSTLYSKGYAEWSWKVWHDNQSNLLPDGTVEVLERQVVWN